MKHEQRMTWNVHEGFSCNYWISKSSSSSSSPPRRRGRRRRRHHHHHHHQHHRITSLIPTSMNKHETLGSCVQGRTAASRQQSRWPTVHPLVTLSLRSLVQSPKNRYPFMGSLEQSSFWQRIFSGLPPNSWLHALDFATPFQSEKSVDITWLNNNIFTRGTINKLDLTAIWPFYINLNIWSVKKYFPGILHVNLPGCLSSNSCSSGIACFSVFRLEKIFHQLTKCLSKHEISISRPNSLFTSTVTQ